MCKKEEILWFVQSILRLHCKTRGKNAFFEEKINSSVWCDVWEMEEINIVCRYCNKKLHALLFMFTVKRGRKKQWLQKWDGDCEFSSYAKVTERFYQWIVPTTHLFPQIHPKSLEKWESWHFGCLSRLNEWRGQKRICPNLAFSSNLWSIYVFTSTVHIFSRMNTPTSNKSRSLTIDYMLSLTNMKLFSQRASKVHLFLSVLKLQSHARLCERSSVWWLRFSVEKIDYYIYLVLLPLSPPKRAFNSCLVNGDDRTKRIEICKW